jgi:hypothetical protein
MIDSEYLALAAGAEELITTGAEHPEQPILAVMIIVRYRCDRASLAFRGSSDAGSIELTKRELSSSMFVELVGYGIHRPSRSVDMDVGQPKQPLQRTLFQAYGLSFCVRHYVTFVAEPALLGDQDALVPAVAEGPEVKPSEPTRARRGRMQLDAVDIETWQYPS